MAKNVLITGVRGIGKTSLIKRLAHDLSMLVVRGFYKEAIFEEEKCRGFRVITFDLQDQILAHIYIEGPDKIDTFGVNVFGFEKLVLPQFQDINKTDLFIFDEVGKMECLSTKFCQHFQNILNLDVPVIATLGINDVFNIKQLKQRKDVTIMQMTSSNRDEFWKHVLVELEQ